MYDNDSNIYEGMAPDKVCFQVVIQYDDENSVVQETVPIQHRKLESDPLNNFSSAIQRAEKTASKIRNMFPGSMVAEIEDLENMVDDYFFYIVDQQDDLIAQVGVSTTDYRKETLH